MAFFNFRLQPKNELEKGGRSAAPVQSDESEPEKKCPNCHRETPISELNGNLNVCACGYHFRMNSRQRLSYLVDKGSFKELFAEIDYSNPIDFPGYTDKIDSAKSLSKEKEGVVCGTAKIGGEECCIFAMEPYFMMGSMGTAVGEKITSLFEYATEHKMSVVGFTVSGGARMQEGLFSLLQMA
ncbi:MAG: carboxyl transferase domain-containing protein, partial [Lachnospiraceae bacterium]|nr:carboxyl transferase domain-containing protein [Lachnospiraceae bacterium]